MISYTKKHIFWALSLALICNVSLAAQDSTQETSTTQTAPKKQGLTRRLIHTVKNKFLWPFTKYGETEDICIDQATQAVQMIKDNLPSTRFKNAANEASEKFNTELRQSIHEGSEQAQEVIGTFGDTINENIAHMKKVLDETVETLTTNVNTARLDHYEQLQKTGAIGATLAVKTICLSACATVGALLLYTNLNNHTGSTSTMLAALGASMLGGSGYIAERVLKAQTFNKDLSDN